MAVDGETMTTKVVLNVPVTAQGLTPSQDCNDQAINIDMGSYDPSLDALRPDSSIPATPMMSRQIGAEKQQSAAEQAAPSSQSMAPQTPPSGRPRRDVNIISNPHDMYENLVQGVTKKVQHRWWQTVGHGILAGAYIGMGGFLALVVGTAPTLKLENPGLQKLVFGLAFPVGLLLVVITGAELFTSNVLSVSTWLDRRTRALRTLGNMVSVWALNFVGALFVAAMAYWSGVFVDKFAENAIAYTEHKVHQSVGEAFAKAVMTNWFVALAVLMAAAAHDFPGKVLAVWPPITAFVAIGLEHSIANQFFLPLGRMLGADYTVGEMLVNNILPVTAGNFAGSLLVSVVYALLESKVSRVSPVRAYVRGKTDRWPRLRGWSRGRRHNKVHTSHALSHITIDHHHDHAHHEHENTHTETHTAVPMRSERKGSMV